MKCKAKTKTGKPCGHHAIKGGTVCTHHGGSAPQVRAKALARIQAMVHPALDSIQGLLTSEQHAVQLAAARDILDRAGYKVGEKHEVSGPDGGPISSSITVTFVKPE